MESLIHRILSPAVGVDIAIIVILSLLLVFPAVISVADETSDQVPDYTGYDLVWNDEFDVDGPPNPDRWGYGREGFIRNHELQWYQDDNVFVRDGLLVIEARQERKKNPSFIEGSQDWKTNRPTIEYTSSLISTRETQMWQYGRFEIRAKIQAKPGLWPAIWTLGKDRPWPAKGEIDIMEYYKGQILANAAWSKVGKDRYASRWDSSKTLISKLPASEDWDQRFHLWRMDWDRDFIRIYVDDFLLNEVDLSKTFNETGDKANPFRQPHYLLLNLALGGDNAENPADTDTEFPAYFHVDYVRVYQKSDQE